MSDTEKPPEEVKHHEPVVEKSDKPPDKPPAGDAAGSSAADAAPSSGANGATSGPANPPATSGSGGDQADGKAQKRNKNEPLSTRKQDFQLRLKVNEARQLPGSNVSPTCRVTCQNQKKQTKVIKSSNAPYWNELFFFNFNASPAELFDEILLFEVYDSKKLRSDSLIGSFKIEIGMVYDEPNHAFINKWLLLCDPEQVSDGHKGYLKVSVALIGPGDDPPSFQETKYGEEDDIEANLLRPAGLILRPATFKLKLYCAEDLPRMDSNFIDGVKQVFGSGDRKELVDPYFRFGFAGRQVDSKVIYTSFSPQWNSELRLGLWFPSMCEKIKLQLFDWDRFTKHDCIGTMNVITSQISQIGNDSASKDEESGFLPMFGPCFVNFYGSPREYSELPTEYDELNFGQGMGVAYRGRVLIELQTVLGELPLTPMEELTNEDIMKAQKFMRRRKFKLHTTFLDACMISAIDAPIEFEVSIGNYGNRLDEFLPPSVCSTQPTNPVFDGCFYYYLPWGEAKPCVVVESHWEDVIFRLEALNYLINFTDRLDAHMANIHLAQKGNVGLQELAISVIKVLDELIEGCKKPLPEPNPDCQVSNLLDKNLHDYRVAVLKSIVKDAIKVREEATDIDESVSEIQSLIEQIKVLVVEPQNSIPDVMIWMITGEKRIACYRCPSNLVMWSSNPDYRGKYCGALTKFVLQYPGKKAQKENKWEIPAMIRGRIWLGLEKDEKEWHSMSKEGELTVFAETYENQVSVLGKWTNRGPTMSRPKWSDVTGKIELNKEQFRAPAGWSWEGDWYINPEMSMLYEKDANLSKYMEDVYECQSRIVGGNWKSAAVAYSDVKGDACAGIKEIELPPGWEWQDDWQVDLNRAVDENGWEYAAEASLGGFGPVEKVFHMSRRRRWLRTRRLTKTQSSITQEAKQKEMIAEGWEYAPLFTMKFHLKERKMDLVRRRRWHRKMVAEHTKGADSAVFQFATAVEEKTEEATEKVYEEAIAKNITSAPRMFMYAKKSYKYQLRAYMYQARDLLAGDSDGLSDPFARVAFLNQSQSTEKIFKTLCPTWDQSLIFESIQIWGEPKTVYENPPDVVMEIFDHDNFGSAQFLGRAFAKPVVKLDPTDTSQPVLLKWYPLMKGNEQAGEVLAAFELFLIDSGKELPFPPPKRGKVYMVPNGIRPQMVRTAVEVMCWGLRNMQKFQLLEVSSPNVELEINGTVQETKVIKDMSMNPNFDDPIVFFDVMLPKEELYAPPINIRVKDNRAFGRRPLVGVNSIKSLQQFRCDPLDFEEIEEDRGTALMGDLFTNAVASRKDSIAADASQKDAIITIEDVEEDDIDWWSKFYASIGEMDKCKKYLEQGYDKIQVYATELEKVKVHNEFKDFCITFPLTRGKAIEDEESSVAGEFKGTFYVYPLPGDIKAPLPPRILRNLPTSSPVECMVRVYVLRAFDLQSNDPSGLADPYIQIKIGKQKIGNNKEYIANTLNPIFGKMFEVKAILPRDKDLIVRVRDYDFASQDDTIGETIIDLENRFLTKCRATAGLPQTYCVTGVCKWRDSKKPSELLEDFCSARMKGENPIYTNNGNMVTIGRRSYNLHEYEQKQIQHCHLGPPKERLSLHILHTLPTQIMGIPLVVEHVETRPLFNTLQPGIEQGKVQMWVDIFPTLLGPPGPLVNISAREPKDFELRIVVWNTKDVILEETSITGEKMSDIYVKGWIGNPENKQETDVHYRSLDGEGNFNWRFVFPFKFIPAEQCLVIKEKEHFWSLDETERRLPPILTIQIWDNDKFSKDDFLGSLELNLNAMAQPTKSSSKCTLDQMNLVGRPGKPVKLVSLFDSKRLKGFWPCASDETGTLELTGKVEMELELVTGQDIVDKPCGKARDDPNQHPFLDPPKRPETSFFWFTSPWKTFKFIVWKKFKWYFITGLIILLIGLFLFLFFYNVPGAAVRKIVGA